MALSSNTMRGLIRYARSKDQALRRLVIWPEDTTPVYSAGHIRPVTTPSGTAAEGDISWNATNNLPEVYTGASWQTLRGQSNYAATATADGLTTGTIPQGVGFVTVTSANADHIIVLPDAPIGTEIWLYVGATGYELRSHSPTTVGINGGTGADAESAIATLILTHCIRSTAVNWVSSSFTAAGVKGVTQVAA